jgi:CHASE3 domain sensor protein
MKTSDFTSPSNSRQLNENLYKKFGVKVNFDKYTREQLENYRNLLRTKLHQQEVSANFNELLSNESYQKDKHLAGVITQRIKEMIGESITVMERAVSKAQQQAAGAALAAKRGGGKAKGASKEMMKMSTKELEKFAGTKHKGLPAKKGESVEEGAVDDVKDRQSAKKDSDWWGEKEKSSAKSGSSKRKVAGKAYGGSKQKDDTVEEAAKPDFLDMDKDGNKKEPMKKAIKDKKVKEAAIDDYLDKKKTSGASTTSRRKHSGSRYGGSAQGVDADGGEESPMKKAVGKKKVKESFNYVFEDEEGKAKSITAGTDMVNDFTSWMTRVGQYQTKSMIELADAIRANFGQAEAEQFKQAVAPALETALNTLTDVREQISNAVAVLAGEDVGMDQMGSEMDQPADMDASEVAPTEPDMMNAAPDEFAAADAAAGGAEVAGRARRESRELFAKKINEAHSILSKLAK